MLGVYSQPSPPVTIDKAPRISVLGSLPKTLKEASGLEMSASGMLWTHNDDRYPVLYALDSTGHVVKAIHLNERNNGWEDLAQDSEGNFYIGAFGNNNNNRKDLAILKIPDPESVTQTIINAEIIRYVYSDQRAFPPAESQLNFDADAFTSKDDSLFIFTKNRTNPFSGYTKVYRLPHEPGSHEALLYDSIYLGNGSMMHYWVTSADISPDGKWLALLSHDCLWLTTGFRNNRFSSGKTFRIPLDNFSHKAGLCFASNEKVFIVDELEFGVLGGQIYAVELADVLAAIQAVLLRDH